MKITQVPDNCPLHGGENPAWFQDVTFCGKELMGCDLTSLKANGGESEKEKDNEIQSQCGKKDVRDGRS